MGYRGRHKARSRFHFLFVILCCLALLMLAYPFLEPFLLETESVTLTSADLPADVGQLKIVYVSDIHQGAYFSQGRVRSLVTRINSLNPDIILLGGDYANTSEEAIAFFQSAPSFHARYLIAAVVGNHDRTAPENNLEALQQAMYDAGIVPLVNSVNRLKIGTDYIYLAGIDDVDNGWPDLEGVAAQVDRNDYVIFLSHSPAILGKALDARDRDGDKGWFDLALCGHTHGGQVTLLGQPIFGVCPHQRPVLAGLVRGQPRVHAGEQWRGHLGAADTAVCAAANPSDYHTAWKLRDGNWRMLLLRNDKKKGTGS